MTDTLDIKDSIIIRYSPQRVFSFLTDSELVAKWWSMECVIDARVGGKIEFVWFNGTRLTTFIHSFIDNSTIAFRFGKENVELSIASVGEAVSRVSVVHTVDATDRVNIVHVAQSWAFLLANLKSVIENGRDLRELNLRSAGTL